MRVGGLSLLALAAAGALAACAVQTQGPAAGARILVADKVYLHAFDDGLSDALVVGADGRVLAVASRAKAVASFPEAPVERIEGVIAPGLIDAHGHLLGLGQSLSHVDLTGAATKQEALARLERLKSELKPGEWALGRGWDQNDWPDKAFPKAADLDALFPDNPVYLERVDGHAAWVNTRAMALSKRPLAGDWQPEGGSILRVNGAPTGILIDAAASYVESAIPKPDRAQRTIFLKKALSHAAKLGLTGVHDAGVTALDLDILIELARKGEMPLRVYAMADGDSQALEDLCAKGFASEPSGRVEMRSVKLYADGALGSRGAALLQDYSDDPGNRGLMTTSPKDLDALLAKAKSCKLQVALHAIGDRANKVALDLFEKHARGDHRWRIEHAQVVALEDLGRFAKLGIIASMQPTHATSDMPWAQARVGPDRIKGAYAWKTLKARLAFGSDFPVESADPRLGLFAGVLRTDLSGDPPGGWRMEEALSFRQTYYAFSEGAAFAAFKEKELGNLDLGRRADFTVWAQDPFTADPKTLPKIAIKATYLDGRKISP